MKAEDTGRVWRGSASALAAFLLTTLLPSSIHAALVCQGDICVIDAEAQPSEPESDFRAASHEADDVVLMQARVCDACDGCVLCEGGVESGSGRSAYRFNPILATRAAIQHLGDRFDSVVFWHDFDDPTSSGVGAFYAHIYVPPNNGLNIGARDDRAVFGSSRLAGFVNMRDTYLVTGCPDCPSLNGSESGVLNVLAQEVGHQWLASIRWTPPDARFLGGSLRGRDRSHWSWYVDSFGSPMEGNHWVASGPDTFDAIPSLEVRYSHIDQYLMGLRPPEEVLPFRLIHPSAERPVSPETPPVNRQVRVKGEAVSVTMDSIRGANGPRSPPFERAVKVTQQAWIYVFPEGEPPEPKALERVRTLRSVWSEVYHGATDGRGRAVTTLDGTEENPVWEFTTDADLDRPGAHSGWQVENGSGRLEGGAWSVLGSEPRLRHERVRFHADTKRTFELELALPEGARGPMRLRWLRSGEVAFHEVEVHAIADDVSRTYAGRMPESVWSGTIMALEVWLPQLPYEGAGAPALLGALRFVDDEPEDADGDGIANESDACLAVADAEQWDADRDGIGDVCDDDRDGDRSANAVDNCPDASNLGQSDSDSDGVGNACDTTPYPPEPGLP